jgi:hypothetical protein
MAERNATVHASAGLLLQRLNVELLVDLAPILDPHVYWTPGRQFTVRR